MSTVGRHRQRLRAWLRSRWAAIALLRHVPRTILAPLIAMYAVTSVLPALSSFASRALAVRFAAKDGRWGAAMVALAVFCALLFGQQALVSLADVLRLRALMLIDGHFRRAVGELALTPDSTAHLDDAATAGKLTMASTDLLIFTAGMASAGHIARMFQFLGGLACLVILGTYSPWLALACLVALMVCRWANARIYIDVNWMWIRTANLAKRTRYWARFGRSVQNAQEIRVYGLAEWSVDRFRAATLAQEEPIVRARGQAFAQTWKPLLAAAAAMFIGLGGIVLGSGSHPETIAQNITALLGAMALGTIGRGGFAVEHGQLLVDTVLGLRDELTRDRQAVTPVAAHRPTSSTTPPLIRFEHVRFSYPCSAKPVLSDVCLELLPGEVLALVGANGAGKTTITRLLARTLEPESGRITAADTNIADLPADTWRRTLALVSQRSMKLDLSIRENIAIGAPERMGDAAFFDGIAGELDLDDIVGALPDRWDTPLSRTRTGGTDLSGGQWRRIALARAVFALRAGRQVLILDEPTAHLDAEAEFETFERLRAAAAGATVILISHRLSTVRTADRIAVLQEGQIAELGAHDALMAEGSDYAQMFTLQAQQFTDVLAPKAAQ